MLNNKFAKEYIDKYFTGKEVAALVVRADNYEYDDEYYNAHDAPLLALDKYNRPIVPTDFEGWLSAVVSVEPLENINGKYVIVWSAKPPQVIRSDRAEKYARQFFGRTDVRLVLMDGIAKSQDQYLLMPQRLLACEKNGKIIAPLDFNHWVKLGMIEFESSVIDAATVENLNADGLVIWMGQ